MHFWQKALGVNGLVVAQFVNPLTSAKTIYAINFSQNLGLLPRPRLNTFPLPKTWLLPGPVNKNLSLSVIETIIVTITVHSTVNMEAGQLAF